MTARSTFLLVILFATACQHTERTELESGSLCTLAHAEVSCEAAAPSVAVPNASFVGHGVWFDADVTVTAAASAYACVVARGQVYCWGIGERGALGDGRLDRQRRGPVKVAGLEDVVDLAADQSGGVCALERDGVVTCWGHATSSADARWSLPAAIEVPPAIDLAASVHETCALTASGAYCWGLHRAPILIPGTADAVRLGQDHGPICAIWAYGRIRCWYESVDASRDAASL